MNIKQHKKLLFHTDPVLYNVQAGCSVETGSVIQVDAPESFRGAMGLVNFVPAAGAASRYLGPVVTQLQELNNMADWRDRLKFRDLLPDSDARTPQEFLEKLLSFPLPKACYPAVQGKTFMEKKIEDSQTLGFENLYFVVPPDCVKYFEKNHGSQAGFFVQDEKMQTCRFFPDGREVEENGRPSRVPAGHGALLPLLGKVGELQQGVCGVFIQNIDNLFELDAVNLEAAQKFFGFYRWVFSEIGSMRAALSENDERAATMCAADILGHLGMETTNPLGDLMEKVFHTKVDRPYLELYNRPLTVLGVVPKSEDLAGGAPVFVDDPDFGRLKICLEKPHAANTDFFASLKGVPFFNPVFLVTEPRADGGLPPQLEEKLWIKAQKKFRGESVLYLETVLYELIGNSVTHNLIFKAIPPSLFRPCKTIEDTASLT